MEYNSEKHEIILLDFPSDDGHYLEVLFVKKGTTYLDIKNAVKKYLYSSEGKNRDSDDSIKDHLIDIGLAYNIPYSYISID